MATLQGDVCAMLQHIKQELPDSLVEADQLDGQPAAASALPIETMPTVARRKYTRKTKAEVTNDLASVPAMPAATRKRVKKEPVEGGHKRLKKDPVGTTGVAQQVKKEIGEPSKLKQQLITDHMPAVKKKRDRFNGLTEEEVLKRTLPDHLALGLDIMIVGINPGLTAAFVGHHYAGPGNHFWKCLYLSGLIPEPMSAYDDFKLLKYGIGFTNIVERTSKGSADLTRKEIKEGGEILKEKILRFQPKIVVFNGKGIYEIFAGHKNFHFGKQPEPFPDTKCTVYVVPSSSARCTQLPRAVDKVPFYVALRKLRDFLRGDVPSLEDSEVTFPDIELKTAPKKVKSEAVEEAAGALADGATRTSGAKAVTTRPAAKRTAKKEPSAKKEPPVTLEPAMGSQEKDLTALLQSYAAAAAAATQPGPLPRIKEEYVARGDSYGVISAPPACSYGVVGHGSYPVTGYPVYTPYWSYMTMAAAGMGVPPLPLQPRPPLTGSAGSSPTASNVSSLTQASLESLPKADSKATVTNWLQSIPNHVDPLVD